MKKLLLFIVILLTSNQAISSEEIVKAYAYNLPLLICYNDEYRACYNNIEVENCASDLKQHREPCLLQVSDPASLNAVSELAACMVASHSGAGSFKDISDSCIKEKGMNINITENSKKIKEADPKWVQGVLE